jgi:hypothetical protein
MPRIIALMALTALELSDAPVHEPVHGHGAISAHPVTVRNIVKSVGPTFAANGDAVCRALICVSSVTHLMRLT